MKPSAATELFLTLLKRYVEKSSFILVPPQRESEFHERQGHVDRDAHECDSLSRAKGLL